MSRREVVETLDKIPNKAPQVWLTREIPPSQVILPLTHLWYKQSSGGQEEAKPQSLVYTPGGIQAQIPARIQLSHQLYKF